MFKREFYTLLLMGLMLCNTAFKTGTQPLTYITLQNEVLGVIPKEFYIAAVEDERKDNTIIGKLQPFATNTDKQAQTYNIDLKGGIAAVKNFVSYALPVEKSRRPVVIKLNTLNIMESPVNNGLVKGDIKLSASFYLQNGEDAVHLVDYKINTTYQRKPGPAQQIEPLIRSALANCLVYLNNWMNAQAGGNIKLAKGVKVSFKDYVEHAEEGDTIYYSVNRPLTWADFKGKQQTGTRNGAEVFASIGYDEVVSLNNGIINVSLTIKVFLPKSASWVSVDMVNANSLNHEQRHFDIAKLVAERFKRNIKAEKLSPDNYDATINMAYLDTLRELYEMQKKYDSETAHSINTYQQQLWNNRIDGELATLGVKKKAAI
jgi:hypothetical protein